MDAAYREKAKIAADAAIKALRRCGYCVDGVEMDFIYSGIFEALKRADDDREA